MEYIYAALLLHEAGKEINAENIKKVLEAAGVEVNEAMVNALVTALEGINIEEVKKEALTAPVAAAPAQAPAEQKKEEKKEEEEKKKAEEEEKKQEEALSGLASLFGL